jgi:hypothetical protein
VHYFEFKFNFWKSSKNWVILDIYHAKRPLHGRFSHKKDMILVLTQNITFAEVKAGVFALKTAVLVFLFSIADYLSKKLDKKSNMYGSASKLNFKHIKVSTSSTFITFAPFLFASNFI